jgi:Family of unknown function (DUF5989)
MSKLAMMREFGRWLNNGEKRYVLLPVVVVLLLFGVILVVAEGSALAPFIYTLF